METDDALKFRANTNNRGYGFEQVIQKNKNLSNNQMNASKSASILERKTNPYQYNARVAANY